MSDKRDRRPQTQPPRSGRPPAESTPPASGPRRERLRSTQRTRSSTQKIRPWSKLPGVVAYAVIDPEGLTTDQWGEPSAPHLARAAAFRTKTRLRGLDGSHVIEPCDDRLRLLSVVRRDGWYVHVWVHETADVAAILSVVGG